MVWLPLDRLQISVACFAFYFPKHKTQNLSARHTESDSQILNQVDISAINCTRISRTSTRETKRAHPSALRNPTEQLWMELHAYLKASMHIYVCVSAPGLKGSLGEHMEWWVKKVCWWWGTETSLTQHSGCWITARRFYLSAFNTPRWVEHTKTRTTYLRISEICFIGPQRFYAVFKKVENDFNLPFNLFFNIQTGSVLWEGRTCYCCAGAVRWKWFFLGSVGDFSMLWPCRQSEPLVIKWRHINSWNVSRYQSVQ